MRDVLMSAWTCDVFFKPIQACTMQHCSRCNQNEGRPCTKCPCENCVVEVNVTRNYTYTVAKAPQADGTSTKFLACYFCFNLIL